METNTSFNDIKKNYANLLVTYRETENNLCRKILYKEKQMQGLEEKKKQLSKTFPHWTELFLRPVIEQLKPAFPEWICDDDILTPMGIGSRVAVFFCKNDKLEYEDKYAGDNSIYICFRPGDLQIGELLFQTGQTIPEYKPGTIGEINGLNKVTKPVESIEELIQFLNAQIIENGTH